MENTAQKKLWNKFTILKEMGIIKTFKAMSDDEKLDFINEKLNRAIYFRKSMEGAGRTYDSSVQLSIEQLEWLINKAR
ncbi:hypothetical protein ABE073_04435 [Lederbergia citrisecunda]|uniref:hypothetical protein n=1 Tax=Lederbergia citrisecunda TaxID=2833583 RepID=UPI003D296B90